jgi:RNA polymerase sigma factor (sigma-70 family)
MTSDSNDRAAWIREALGRFEGQLLRYAFRLTGNLETGREVVQETFLRLCGQQPEDLNGELAAWLYTVCRHRALDVLRKEKRMALLTENQTAEVVTPEREPREELEKTEQIEQVRQMLTTFTDQQQEVVRLKYIEGLSYRDISQVTGLSQGNVGYLLHMALKRIREQLPP